MAKAETKSIKKVRLARNTSSIPGGLVKLADQFIRLEAPINDLVRMSQISVDMATDLLEGRAESKDKNEQISFAIHHLHEMITAHLKAYYAGYERAANG